MNKSDILARNLLILQQLDELSNEFRKYNIRVILLKGVALITLIPEYIRTRVMEDIDILIKPKDLRKTEKILYNSGYKNAPYDPWSYLHKEKTAYVDLCTELWYLNKKENTRVWLDAVTEKDVNAVIANKVNSCEMISSEAIFSTYMTPSLEDLYIHIFSHWKFHHSENNEFGKRDLDLIDCKFGNFLNHKLIEQKLKGYFGRKVFNQNFNGVSGHIKRFIFLPLLQKLNYLLRNMFPSFSFVKKRYSIRNNFYLIPYYIFRPFLLLSKIFYGNFLIK